MGEIILRGADLTAEDLERYDRQIRLPALGEEGQRRLKGAKVVVVGAGGLGSPCSIYLAVAGVGHIVIYDSDVVELSNLNRQILHGDEDIGRPKAVSAREKLQRLNGAISIETRMERLDEANVDEAIRDADVVVDCLDNFATRYLLNEACIRLGKPLVHATIYGLEGHLTTIIPGKTPCLVCLYGPERPPEIKPFPVIGVTPGVIGTLEALEAIKLITGMGRTLAGRFLRFDGEEMTFEIFEIRRKSNCPACGNLRRKGVR